MRESVNPVANGRFEAEREFLRELRQYPSPGAGVMERVARVALEKSVSLVHAAHSCGVLESYADSIKDGSRTLDRVPLSVLVKIANFLTLEPFALLVEAGFLRQGDFVSDGKRAPLEPYGSDWREWLQTTWAKEIRQLVDDFGVQAEAEPVNSGQQKELVGDSDVGAAQKSTAEKWTGEYLREWLIHTCQAREDSLLAMGQEIGLHVPELGQFLHNTIEPESYSRPQYQRFAGYLGMPVVCVFAAVDLLVTDERRVVSV